MIYYARELPFLSFQLLATQQGACSVQKRPAKDATKIAVYLSNPRGRTWTAGDQFFPPFPVVKQYDIAWNLLINSCHKIRNNDDRDFAPKMTFIRTLKIFREFGMLKNPLGRTEPPGRRG